MDSVQKRDRNRKSREKKENKAARKQERAALRKQRKDSGFSGPSAVPSPSGDGEILPPGAASGSSRPGSDTSA